VTWPNDFGFGGSWLGSSYGRNRFPTSLGEFRQSLWSPQIETFEREGKLVIRADLPGLTKDDVNVEITDDAINISGERRNEDEERREGYYRSERSYGGFFRSIQLPEGANAEMRTQPSTTAFLRLQWRLRSSNRADAGWRSKRELQAMSRLAVRQPIANHDFRK
jgi:HSP20 family molecular chaperone IbpA